MNTSTVISSTRAQPDGRAPRRILRRAVVALLMVGAAGAATSGSAEALSIASYGRYPGTAQHPVAQLLAPGTFDLSGPDLNAPARRVYENPTYGGSWQYVCVTARLLTYHYPNFADPRGYWYVLRSADRQCKWISPAATSVTMPMEGFDLGMSDRFTDLSMDVVVSWQLQSGAALGHKVYSYDRGTDYQTNDASLVRAQGYEDGRYWFWVG